MKNPVGKLGRPTPKDAVAGLVTGLFSIPEGMAYASIGGFSPLAGLYSGVVPTILGSLFARTVLMVTTLTSAIALSSQSVLQQAGLDPTDPGNIATLVILVGLVMAIFGLLKLGSVMSFVSNAVMTGFTTGIAVQIVAGVLKDATAYAPQSSNTIGKIVDWLLHLTSWDPTSTVVAGATILAWALVRLVRPLKALATLIALGIVTVLVVVLHLDVEQVSDIASIPRSLPPLVLPDLGAVPHLLLGAVAVSLVGLAQAAGISAAVPNPDGSRSDTSRDFLAQGVANVGGGLFGALPTGGSLSRTGVGTSAGAQTRWAGIFAGVWLAVIVVTLGPFAELIPMPVIGGLLLVIGGELIVGRIGDIKLVVHTAPLPTVAMIVTFLATTALPLQDAIFLGAGLSLLLYCVSAARAARLIGLVRQDDGWREVELPTTAPSNEVTVVYYAGVSLFAELPQLDERSPDTSASTNAVLILGMRALPDVPSSTLLKILGRMHDRLEAEGNRLLVAGAEPKLIELLDRGGALERLGRQNVFPATPLVFEALEQAVAEGERWIRDRTGEGPTALTQD